MADAIIRRPRADDETVKDARVAVAAAQKARYVRKATALDVYREELLEADNAFAEVVALARENRVPWHAIEKAAGMNRQWIDQLVKARVPSRDGKPR